LWVSDRGAIERVFAGRIVEPPRGKFVDSRLSPKGKPRWVRTQLVKSCSVRVLVACGLSLKQLGLFAGFLDDHHDA
jgi:hypothetical protein